MSGSSPHTRGARASIGSVTGACLDHPRIRGEHPTRVSSTFRTTGSSPHTRGAHDGGWKSPNIARIIPAYAGSTGGLRRDRGVHGDHPRIRGEHQSERGKGRGRSGSSPHTRGARQPAGDGHKIPRIIPAYAGSTSSYPTCELPRTDHPRIRGEHASPAPPPDGGPGSSPHTRGAPSSSHTFVPHSGIIPAYAGSTASRKRGKPESSDHPRIRGEHLSGLYTGDGQFGSSPHTRGARQTSPEHGLRQRIIPAYAGSTARRPVLWGARGDHPRIRGEHKCGSRLKTTKPGSSPHTRGAHHDRDIVQGCDGIIPAYAGSTAAAGVPSMTACGSSPHTRGALGAGGAPAGVAGIIPAYAGSTDATYPFGLWYPDHPRIRGEHAGLWVPSGDAEGSSPHTRGARHRHPRAPGR